MKTRKIWIEDGLFSVLGSMSPTVAMMDSSEKLDFPASQYTQGPTDTLEPWSGEL